MRYEGPETGSIRGTIRAFAITLAVVAAPVLAAAGDSLVAPELRYAFVTSVDGTADLGSWPEADPMTSGLEAADSICRNLATAAGLDFPSNFVAWLSDEADDAYCRMHGLTGKKSANCGEPQLPANSGPWVRTDGAPFAPPIEELTSSPFLVFTALGLDETQTPVGPTDTIFTATDPSGERHSLATTCSDWTVSNTDFARGGAVDRTTNGWTNAGSIRCDRSVRLICLETVPGLPLPLVPPPTRTAFVTSASGPGDLGSWPEADPGTTGMDAGDSICRNLADAAGLPDAADYVAWLSDGLTNAIDRLTHDGPWQRFDGIPLAENKADLSDGGIYSSVTWTEELEVLGNAGVWTGTTAEGIDANDNCQGWTSSSDADQGRSGAANSVGTQWTENFIQPCDSTFLSLYCFLDTALIFADGFESGDIAVWSSSSP